MRPRSPVPGHTGGTPLLPVAAVVAGAPLVEHAPVLEGEDTPPAGGGGSLQGGDETFLLAPPGNLPGDKVSLHSLKYQGKCQITMIYVSPQRGEIVVRRIIIIIAIILRKLISACLRYNKIPH